MEARPQDPDHQADLGAPPDEREDRVDERDRVETERFETDRFETETEHGKPMADGIPTAGEPAPTDMTAAAASTSTEPTSAELAYAEPVADGVGDRWTSDEGTLVRPEEAEGFTRRWEDVQAEFLDSPRRAVEGADRLVVELIEYVSARLTEQRAGLEARWNGGAEGNTEDLRVTMQRYRDLFRRLLAG